MLRLIVLSPAHPILPQTVNSNSFARIADRLGPFLAGIQALGIPYLFYFHLLVKTTARQVHCYIADPVSITPEPRADLTAYV